MSLVSQIEELGAALDAGLLDRDAAVQQLVEYSDGGLTRLGAERSLGEWQTIGARYGDIFMRTEMDLAAVESQLRRAAGGQS